MDHAYLSKERTAKALATGMLLLSSLSFFGCATSGSSSLMDARAEAAATPKANVYPHVEDLPPKRPAPAMTADERLKLEKELIAARDHQAKAGAAARQPASPTPF
jgi:hypothetical protein